MHGIVKNFQGDISVTSQPGAGTKFNIFLPVISDIFDSLPEKAAVPILRGNEHLLVVDDDIMLVKTYQVMLHSLGYKADIFSNSRTALEVFRSSPDTFELIITDMTMPKLTGIQLAAAIRTIRPQIPIILFTGYSEIINEEMTKAAGIRDIVIKPVKMKDLAQAIRKVLES